MFKRVENDTAFVRDSNNRALLNIDSSGLAAYKKKKQAVLQQKNQINALANDVNMLKNEMSEIKNLLKCLLDK